MPAGPPVAVRIESLAAGGDGVGHLADGRVVFVPLSAPGDLCEVTLVEEHPRYAKAVLARVLEPSEDRVEPTCVEFGRCGGCEWQHVAYSAQLRAKAELIREALARIGGVEWGDVEVTPSPRQYGYRHRARLLRDRGGVGFRERRSHRICVIDECPVLAPSLNARLTRLARESGEVELLAGRDGAVRVGADPERIEIEVGSDRLAISPGVFVQSNGLMLDELAHAVRTAAVPDAEVGSHGALLELFAGAGFFTLGLARSFDRVWAIEANAAAAGDLSANLRTAGIDHVRVSTDDAGALADEFADFAPDVVVLDPPRAGLAPALAEGLGELAVPRIVYLSCDPATLARDLRTLIRHGFQLANVRGFDLFPQTSHVETLVVLTRI